MTATDTAARSLRGRPPWKRFLLLGFLTPLVVFYVLGALAHSNLVNTDMTATDQSAYMNYAAKMRRSGYTFVGGRNRMPVYPFLQSVFYRGDLTESQFFERGKRVNLGLSALLLVALFIIFRSRLPLLMSISLILITAFTVFIFKAAYFQCELLYYFLSFCTFLLMVSLLRRPGWKRALLTGSLAGLTHLTKASILPGLVVFIVVALGWFLYRAIRRPREAGDGERPLAGVAAVGLVALAFLAVVYPYLRTSKRVFGRYFYNVNSTFYIWYDTPEQVYTGTRLHGDRQGWPKMPAAEIPGPLRYYRQHTTAQIIDRITEGFRRIHAHASRSYGYYKYVLLYAAFALFVLARRPRAWWPLRGDSAAQAVFCPLYIGSYLLLFAWASAVTYGVNRLSLQMFLPLMFCLAWVASTVSRDLPRFHLRGWKVGPAQVFHAAVMLLVMADIYVVLTGKVLAMYGGE